MIVAQDSHQSVLKVIYILKLIDHDVFESFLPLEFYFLTALKYVEDELDKVIVVESEAFFLLVKVPVKQYVVHLFRLQILLPKKVDRHSNHIAIILRLELALPHLEHIPGILESLVPKCQVPLAVDDLQHGIYIRIIEHQKALRILDRVGIFLQNRYTEAVKCAYITGVIIPGQLPDAGAHFIGGFVGKGHAQNIGRQNADFIYKEREPVRESPRLAAARTGDHSYKSLCGGHRLPLALTESF